MAAGLTTHVLDTTRGVAAAGLRVVLHGPGACAPVELTLDRNGRATLLAEGLVAGAYVVEFHVADYHRSAGYDLAEPPFLDVVSVAFGVSDVAAHYHVPLLVSPYGYSTYRGS